MKTIREEIEQANKVNPLYGPKAYDFLIEIAQLVIKARRTLAYTYPIRYYLTGSNKQAFFDFMQADLEYYLELLTKNSEKNWREFTECDVNGRLTLGDKFEKFKSEITNLKVVLEKAFDTISTEIANGMPGVKAGKDEVDT